MRMSAQAPSLILAALAAVIVPILLKTGLSKGIFSYKYFLYSSSSFNSSFSNILIGVISSLNLPRLTELMVRS